MSGTARTRVAEVNAYQEPKAPCQSAPSAATASYPASSSPDGEDRKAQASRAATAAPYRATGRPSSRRSSAREAPAGASDERTPRHHDHPVGQVEHLVQVARVKQNRRARGRRRPEPRVNGCRGADIEAARGIFRHHHRGSRSQLPSRATSFCWFPPLSVAAGRSGPDADDPVVSDEAPRCTRCGAASRSARRGSMVLVPAQPRTTFSVRRELGDQTLGRAVLRNESHRPATSSLPRSGATRPATARSSSRWPLPSTAATPTISPAANRERRRAARQSRTPSPAPPPPPRARISARADRGAEPADAAPLGASDTPGTTDHRARPATPRSDPRPVR